jgi:hypothetical protein
VGGRAGANHRLMGVDFNWDRDKKIAFLHPRNHARRHRGRFFDVGKRDTQLSMITTLVEGTAGSGLYPLRA